MAEKTAPSRRAAGGALAAAAVAGLALGVRLVGLDHTVHTDELNHVLAARSLLENGTLAIADGDPYSRAQLFTKLVAVLFRVFGEGVVIARIPAVAGGTLLVLAVFLWVRAVLGRTAGWVAALLLCFNPLAIYLSQTVFFYAWQVLLAWLGAIAVFHLVGDLVDGKVKPGWLALLGAAALLSFAIALTLQPLTMVDCAGVGIWAVAFAAPHLWERSLPAARRRAAGAVVVAVGLAAAIAVVTAGEAAWQLYRYAPPHAMAHRTDFGFYHRLMLEDYATLWPLLPLAWLAAAAVSPRPLGFLGSLLTVSFVFHSLAAWKHERYVFHALPALCAILGAAAQVILPRAHAMLAGLLAGRRARRGAAVASGAILAAALLFLVASTGAFSSSLRLLTVRDADWDSSRRYRGEADWRSAAGPLRAIADSVDCVVSSNAAKAIYYLGRADYMLGVHPMVTAEGREPEFARSPQVGRPMISAPESVARVMEEHATGLIVVEAYDWHTGWGVPGGTANLIAAYADPVPIPGEWRLLAFRWRPLAE